MAGRGPQPKDPDRRARGARGDQLRVLTPDLTEQPELPVVMIGNFEVAWPERTREWWRIWRDSPLSADFTSTDWSELLDTALVHARLWSGDIKAAAELRLRVAKFGATPEDRARLRITFAQADDAEKRTGKKAPVKRRTLTAA